MFAAKENINVIQCGDVITWVLCFFKLIWVWNDSLLFYFASSEVSFRKATMLNPVYPMFHKHWTRLLDRLMLKRMIIPNSKFQKRDSQPLNNRTSAQTLKITHRKAALLGRNDDAVVIAAKRLTVPKMTWIHWTCPRRSQCSPKPRTIMMRRNATRMWGKSSMTHLFLV